MGTRKVTLLLCNMVTKDIPTNKTIRGDNYFVDFKESVIFDYPCTSSNSNETISHSSTTASSSFLSC